MKLARDFYRKLTDHHLHGFDPILLGSIALLCLTGLLMIYSASSAVSERLHGTSLIFLRNHVFHLALGLTAMAVAMRVPFGSWKTWVPFGLGLSLVLLVLVLIPGIGHEVSGARRWLRLGPVGIQPTELLKLVLIANAAYYLTRKQELVAQFIRGVAPSLAVMAVFLGLVTLQPDFGTAVLIAMTLLLMIFCGGAKLGHIMFSVAGFGLIGVWLIASQSYRVKRMLAFLDPWQDRLDTGFQIVQSYLAFGNGGWLGVGLGDSRQKMFFL
ncbi:MAG: FtsW/RodA/SpoVE family cell cycle protein, partial [SAR324 cluster bacterium]|nr:FtsW/RodA/SpoVE family cell cycle protein [SAR324 cluster bacterium]